MTDLFRRMCVVIMFAVLFASMLGLIFAIGTPFYQHFVMRRDWTEYFVGCIFFGLIFLGAANWAADVLSRIMRKWRRW